MPRDHRGAFRLIDQHVIIFDGAIKPFWRLTGLRQFHKPCLILFQRLYKLFRVPVSVTENLGHLSIIRNNYASASKIVYHALRRDLSCRASLSNVIVKERRGQNLFDIEGCFSIHSRHAKRFLSKTTLRNPERG